MREVNMRGQVQLKMHTPPKKANLARPIHTERDYREAKALLARTMRSARSTESAMRAEALLREIVDYEMRVDAEQSEGWGLLDADLDAYAGPRRRWNDDEDG
jgi:hypothetical protein